MAIGVNTNTSSADLTLQGNNTITVTKPTGTANSDILVIVWGQDNGAALGTITAASGWTSVNTAVSNSKVKLYAFWSLGSNTNLGFPHTAASGTDDIGWVMAGFTGVDNTTPIDATGTTNSNSGSTSLTTNAVTVATDQAWHCIPFIDWNGNSTFSATGFTAKQNAGTHATAGLLYNTTPKSAGSTGTVAVSSSASGTGQFLSAMPFALRPAATFAPPPFHRSQRFFRRAG